MMGTAVEAIDRADLLRALVAAAARAGDIVWDHFRNGCRHELKSDQSPVTAADRDGEKAILAALAKIAPSIPVVAEEQAAAGLVPEAGDRFFLVDPLDGTKEFIGGGTDFTVNIGLVENGAPTLGVVYAPARGEIYWGDTASGRAYAAGRKPGGEMGKPAPIAIAPPSPSRRAVASKSHSTPATEAWLEAMSVTDRVSIGSSLKFVLVACGKADVYPRPAPTMEWDTAAGDAILRAAGGRVFDLAGEPLRYGKPGHFNPGFLATAISDVLPLGTFVRPEVA